MKEQKVPIENALFPVVLRDIYLKGEGNQQQRSLLKAEKTPSAFVRIHRFKAVVAQDNQYVFSVVAPDYKLITNEEAIDLGFECFNQVFSVTKMSEMEPYNLIMPGSRSFCHIDFVHKKRELKLFKDDLWSPYFRISNSYNRMFALKFDLGFCRAICMNGVIFGKRNIEFKFHHSRRASDPRISFNISAQHLADLEKQFTESLLNLKRYHVPKKYMWPLVCKVYGLRLPENPSQRQFETFKQRERHISSLTKGYFQKLGENGYAALNVLSDFASRPIGYISAEQRVNSLQRDTGIWIDDFVSAIDRRDFSFENYLGDFAQYSTAIVQ